MPDCSEQVCFQMSSNKNYINSAIFRNQDITAAFTVCTKKKNLMSNTVEGDTDGDVKKDAHIKERKVAVVSFLWEKGLQYLFFQKPIATLSIYAD